MTSEVWCLDSLRPGQQVSGSTRLAQACYRRLNTPRGTLRDGDEGSRYGIDLCAYVGALGTNAKVAMPGIISAELMKDPRVASVDVRVSERRESNGSIRLDFVISVVAANGEDVTFRVSATASDSTFTSVL